MIGRGLSYPTALEAALKIKEVSYIHAEGFAGGELKHGVIALIEPGTPCVVYAPNDETRADILSGAMELRSRGGYIIGIGPDPRSGLRRPSADPRCRRSPAPLVKALPAQMLGYTGTAARQRSRQAAQPGQERDGEVTEPEPKSVHDVEPADAGSTFVDTHIHLDEDAFAAEWMRLSSERSV